MKCARCEKEFLFEFLCVQQWLQQSTLDNQQFSFLLYNYGGSLSPECEGYLQRSYYLSMTNPYWRNSKHTK